MNKVFIHLRGATGCGKSTTARQFMEHGNFELRHIDVRGKKYPYNKDEKQNIIVTGEYSPSRTCGGLDGVIDNVDIMLDYLAKLIKLKPDAVVFEAVMYGMTVSFAEKIVKMCQGYGMHYKGVVLCPPFEANLAMIYSRNGGKQINAPMLYEKGRAAIRSANALKRRGVDIEFVDTSTVKYEDMWKIVGDRIERKAR